MKVLVIEDEKLVAESIRAILEHKGFDVETVYDGEAGTEYAELGIYDLLILDVMMPRLNGFQVARQVRADRCATPILMLTARTAERDKIAGLGAGADDYMTKPFGLGELLARIAALLRRARLVPVQPPRADAPFRLGAHMIDGARLTVIAPDGTETPLAAREYELLRLLAAHPGEVLRRDDILDELWGVAFHGNTRTLDQHVALIRRKLGADAARIETVRNVGYRLA